MGTLYCELNYAVSCLTLSSGSTSFLKTNQCYEFLKRAVVGLVFAVIALVLAVIYLDFDDVAGLVDGDNDALS